jgi:hypothetical protein
MFFAGEKKESKSANVKFWSMETLTDVNALQSFANICPALTGRVMTGDRPIGPSVFCRLFNRKKIIHPDIRNHLFPLVCTQGGQCGKGVRRQMVDCVLVETQKKVDPEFCLMGGRSWPEASESPCSVPCLFGNDHTVRFLSSSPDIWSGKQLFCWPRTTETSSQQRKWNQCYSHQQHKILNWPENDTKPEIRRVILTTILSRIYL